MKKAFLTLAAALIVAGTFRPSPLLSHEVVNTTVTFDKEIVRILNRKCIACHSENNLGVPLTSYEQTRPWARAIEEEVLRRHMPPWRAVPGYGQFVNDVGLTNRELQLIVAWVEGNGPKNKDQRLIVNIDQGQTPQNERLKPDFAKWQLGDPDLLKTLDPNSIAPGQPDEVRRVTVDLGLSSDRWIRALEFKPGDRRVVRAAFFSLQETGQWLGSWTPWYGVTTLPPDVAYLAPAGSHVVAEIHYRSASQPVNDQGTLGLYFAPRPAAQSPTDLVLEARQKETSDPAHVVSGFLPAGLSAVASAKVEALAEEGSRTPLQKFSASVQLPTDINVLAFKPEVQAGVESVEVRARKPDGTVQVLLLVRGVLADWPTPYVLKEPVPLPKNSELSVAIHYKNAGATMAPAVLKLITSTAP